MKKTILGGLLVLFISACSSTQKSVKSTGNERAHAAEAQSEMSQDIN